ncbi:hypothetical protein PF005_g16464 [Phytophthora fragariae]|uniref:CWH43-like N-terminal domain-containing protein n=1 Tax=Phytophthora fragariae TaxID=53985 RepID=A0A6A3RGP9_9STRA|nr:hypothetical protein PF009_g17835 [Phytophthora fragariae]KAE8997486.1 hypothetical protein PF011_g15469 [Phytophthora fragariae]KAE9097056.1 hypothetical protein PF007_g16757 [Phytophthora fragariae]KAE9098036.1 hypothetical protein PF010_g15726 [Phytophthora fragariae]KAE9197565.1 hypothetical protein PF005_g16464 [Phytophthora fragariae]
MATVRPISLEQRNPDEQLRNPLLTWHRSQSLDSDDDGDVSSSSSDSESDSEGSFSVSSSSASSSVSSDQEDDFDSTSDSESNSSTSDHEEDDEESGRPPQTVHFHSKTPTESLVDTLVDMARADNLGYIAWLVPLTGICTMLGTELLACTTHFSCSQNFPTLSYAATFRPEAFAFTGGMCLTAVFILASAVLFFWYLRLRMTLQRQVKDEQSKRTKHLAAGYASLVSGVTAAVSLFGLAVMDMRSHHDAHINFTIAFFVAAWATMIAVQVARKSILHEDETDGKSTADVAGLVAVLRRRSFWMSLRRWRRLEFFTAYTLGRLLLNVGLASTFLFALFFLCANGVWPNPLGFTAVQEAFFEALAIVCQLLFMGTLSCELARLARLVEHSDYTELERSE